VQKEKRSKTYKPTHGRRKPHDPQGEVEEAIPHIIKPKAKPNPMTRELATGTGENPNNRKERSFLLNP
jgi:hypothetical protein